jgi:hypothetical protein
VRSTPLVAATLVLLVLWRRILKPVFGRRAAIGRGSPRPWLLDRAIYAIARLEGWAARLHLPFGSSHPLIARKR